jgi:type 2 lantibiotic biosynthesis protein LanM
MSITASPGETALPEDRLIAAAAELAARLRAAVVRTRDGTPLWLAPRASAAPGKPAAVGPHLYDGTLGIALFLAAFDRIAGGSGHRELVLASIAPLRRRLASPSPPNLGLGGLIGLGSILYGLTRIGTFLDEPELVGEARGLIPLITPERIAADGRRDVLLGAAGAILSLLALERALPQGSAGPDPLAAALACARHVLEGQVSWDGRPAAWPAPPDRPPLSGFSHGAAGIACALLALYRRTGRRELLDAAREGISFERTLYSSEAANWLDLRFPGTTFMTSWCNGAPGIALGRLAALDALAGPEIEEDVERALATTLALEMTPADHVCCGNLGRVEILLYAAGRLGDDGLRGAAHSLAGRVLERARSAGGFGFSTEPGGPGGPGAIPWDPSLFHGAAGIGYGLLRLARPAALPSVLALE